MGLVDEKGRPGNLEALLHVDHPCARVVSEDTKFIIIAWNPTQQRSVALGKGQDGPAEALPRTHGGKGLRLAGLAPP